VELHFVDLGRRVGAESGQTVLEACEAAGIDMVAACGGFAACNSCRVRLVDGALSAVDELELPFLDEPGQRLGCQARVVGDATLRMEPGC
jgi:ferredoxin